MEKFNLEKLVKVKLVDFEKSIWYFYFPHKPKKYFWQSEQKEGIYIESIGGFDYKKDILKNHTVKDGIVYINPRVIMYFESNIATEKYFDNIEQAKSFAEEITNGKNWLLI
jgi:hypothetical protein